MVDSRSQIVVEVTGRSSELGILEKNGDLPKSSDIDSNAKADAEVEVATNNIQKNKVDKGGDKEDEAELRHGAALDNDPEDSEVMEDEVDDEVQGMNEDEFEDGNQTGTQVDDKVEDAEPEDGADKVTTQREGDNIAREYEEQILLELQEDSQSISEKKRSKRLEVFVGGIDNDMTNEQVQTVFEKVGKVVEVRMTKSSQTGKNKGFAFVRFSECAEAKKAVEEFHNSQVFGKICRVTPSLENDILYLGNINKEWKKDNLMGALDKYKIGNLLCVNLLEDPHDDGKNRGYAFLEFTSHKEAMKAFVRLRQRDCVVGGDRSAKVAWSRPFSDPDEETMSQVKRVFIEGMPLAWDREHVTEHFGKYGEIEDIVLASDKASTKRKDFGFVEYATREAAMACIEAVDKTDVDDGDQKVMLKVKLSKPIHKVKSWRGEIRGNFPIEKDSDGGIRSPHRGGKARKRRKSSGRQEKSQNSHGNGDRSDHRKRSPLGRGIASHRITKFSSAHSGDESGSRRKSKISSSHLERQGLHGERLARESRKDSYQYRREGRDYVNAVSGRKRGFSDLEADPRYLEIPLASRSRARLVHPEELAFQVGGTRIPYYESPARAAVGRVPRYDLGQPMPLPAAPVQAYGLFDPLSSGASGRTLYPFSGYAYDSMYSNAAEIARGTSYASSPYGLHTFGSSRYSVPGADFGPYY